MAAIKPGVTPIISTIYIIYITKYHTTIYNYTNHFLVKRESTDKSLTASLTFFANAGNFFLGLQSSQLLGKHHEMPRKSAPILENLLVRAV